MADGSAPLVFITAAFLFAGFIKGAIGIGLPTVVMGLLSIRAELRGLVAVLPVLSSSGSHSFRPHAERPIHRLPCELRLSSSPALATTGAA